MLYFGNYRWPKLVKLHRAKERQPPSLSNQTSVYTLSPEGGVVWDLPYCWRGDGGWGSGGILVEAEECECRAATTTYLDRYTPSLQVQGRRDWGWG